MIEAVAVTGGNGSLGRAALRELQSAGYRTVNIARGKRREDIADEYRTTDLTVPGEVYGSLAMADVDGIVHAGTIRDPCRHPGYVTFQNNVMSTYHVLEAASALDVSSVCLAGSINVMGGYWQATPIEIEYLPVDEDHPLRPRDPYAMAKHAIETTAAGFGRQEGPPRTITTLRFPTLLRDEQLREAFVDPERTLETVDHESGGGGGRDDLFSYLHIDDAARAARSAIEADFAGHETCWAVASDTTMDVPSRDLVSCYPGVEDPGLDDHEALIDTSKAHRLLEWTPDESWRTL